MPYHVVDIPHIDMTMTPAVGPSTNFRSIQTQSNEFAVMSLSKLNMEHLRLRLLDEHGETAPKSWSKTQLLLRLTELEGIEQLQRAKKEVSPLRAMEIRINQASVKKHLLQKMAVEEFGLTLTGNETIAMLRVRCMGTAMAAIPGHPEDKVGFGEWGHLSYAEIQVHQPKYCRWVIQTAQEGQACMRLCRLATWLKLNEDDIEMIKDNKIGMGKTTKTRKPKKTMGYSAASSSNTTETDLAEVMGGLVETVKSLAQDMKQLKAESKEAKRKTHNSGDVTTGSSDWEKPAEV